MKKIPTLFNRDWDGTFGPPGRLVLPGPALVDVADALPTRKRDGTCCLVRDGKLYKRYDAKFHRTPPPGFELVEADAKTGHCVGWVPVGDGPEDKYHREAFSLLPYVDGTYELCGPKIQGNPEGFENHCLVLHGCETLHDSVPTDYDGLREYLANHAIEGIVWWRREPIAKIKRRDFGFEWPIPVTCADGAGQ